MNKSIHVLTWNICFRAKLFNKKLDPFFSWEIRKYLVLFFIKRYMLTHPRHILCFQEVQRKHLRDLKNLVGKEYHIFEQEYYPKKKFMLVTMIPKSLDESPEQIDLGEENMRFLTVRTCEFTLMNLHHHVEPEVHEVDHERLVDWVGDFLAEDNGPLMIVGDGNTFDNHKGVEMIKALVHKGMYDLAYYLKNQDNKRINYTFKGYPGDSFQDEGLNPLDHMLISEGIEGKGMIANDEKTLRVIDGEWGPSDHFPCSAEICVK